MTTFKKVFSSPLSRQYIFWTLLFGSILTLVFTAIEVSSRYYQEKNSIQTELELIISSYTQAFSRSVWELNITQTTALLEGISNLPNISTAMLTDSDIDIKIGPEPDSSAIYQKIQITYPVKGSHHHLGYLVVYGDLNQVISSLKKLTFILLLSNFIKSNIFFLFSFIVFRLLVSRHLQTISTNIQSNDLLIEETAPFSISRNTFAYTRNDEIDAIVSALNNMRLKLSSANNLHQMHFKMLGKMLNSLNQYVCIYDAQGLQLLNNCNQLTDAAALTTLLSTPHLTTESICGAASKLQFRTNIITQHEKQALCGPLYLLEIETPDEQFWHLQSVLFKDGGFGYLLANITELRVIKEQLHRTKYLESIATLTSSVAHEFNNMLSILLNNMELLEADASLTQTARERVNSSLNAVNYAKQTTQQLLSYSQQSKHSTVNTVDLQILFTQLENYALTIKTNHIYHFDNKSTYSVNADQNMLFAALINLMNNASEATSSGTVTVSTRNINTPNNELVSLSQTQNGYVVFDVIDTGPGVPEHLQSKIFTPFFSTKGKGTGLGLWIVSEFAKQSRGKVSYVIDPQGSSKFSLYLPATTQLSPSSIEKKANQATHISGLNALIVDDEPVLLHSMEDFFLLQGIHVTTSESCLMALQAIDQSLDNNFFDFIICDLGLRDGLGSSIIQYYKENHPDGFAILISGYAENEDIKSEGVDLFLQKPISLFELKSIVNQHIQNPQTVVL